jgi:hypothetical protein
MILILSEYEDTNTDEVCEWLNYFEVMNNLFYQELVVIKLYFTFALLKKILTLYSNPGYTGYM